jgi:hypothetical protein
MSYIIFDVRVYNIVYYIVYDILYYTIYNIVYYIVYDIVYGIVYDIVYDIRHILHRIRYRLRFLCGRARLGLAGQVFYVTGQVFFGLPKPKDMSPRRHDVMSHTMSCV